MSYDYRTPEGVVDPAKLSQCRRKVEHDSTLSAEQKTEWLARFDTIERSKDAKFPGKVTASTSGDDILIDLNGDIGESYFSEGITSKAVAKQLEGKKGKITMRVHSGGGSAFEGMAIHSLLAHAPNESVTEIIGLAGSAATIASLGARKVRMVENGGFFIHGGSTVAAGDVRTLKSRVQLLETINEAAATSYARKTGRPIEEMRKLMDDSTWMTAAKAKELGFVDEIMPPAHVTALLDPADIPPEIAARFAPKQSGKSRVAAKLGLDATAKYSEILAALDARLSTDFTPPDDDDEPEVPEVTPPAAPVPPPPAPQPNLEAALELHKASVQLAVERAISAGKLTPALRDTAIAACGTTPESLTAQLALWERMPEVVARKATSQGKPLTATTMTASQLRYAKQANLSPEQWLAAQSNKVTESRDA